MDKIINPEETTIKKNIKEEANILPSYVNFGNAYEKYLHQQYIDEKKTSVNNELMKLASENQKHLSLEAITNGNKNEEIKIENIKVEHEYETYYDDQIADKEHELMKLTSENQKQLNLEGITNENENEEIKMENIKVEHEYDTYYDDQIADTEHSSSKMLEFVEVQYIKAEEKDDLDNAANVCDPININEGINTSSVLPETSTSIPEDNKNNEITNNDDLIYKCTRCPRAFNKPSSLNKHLQVHVNEKINKCSVCDKIFQHPSKLKVHMRTHTGEKRYKCTECDRGFTKSMTLIDHMRVHTGETPYACTVCSKSFRIALSLEVHMRIQTGERPYKCEYCTKVFRNSSSYVGHMRIHNNVKPYKCSQCERKFRLMGNLNSHMRLHTGLKSFHCKWCNKAFSRSNNLTLHERIHNGDRPYKCNQCNKTFTVSSSLNRHMKLHSGEKSS